MGTSELELDSERDWKPRSVRCERMALFLFVAADFEQSGEALKLNC